MSSDLLIAFLAAYLSGPCRPLECDCKCNLLQSDLLALPNSIPTPSLRPTHPRLSFLFFCKSAKCCCCLLAIPYIRLSVLVGPSVKGMKFLRAGSGKDRFSSRRRRRLIPPPSSSLHPRDKAFSPSSPPKGRTEERTNEPVLPPSPVPKSGVFGPCFFAFLPLPPPLPDLTATQPNQPRANRPTESAKEKRRNSTLSPLVNCLEKEREKGKWSGIRQIGENLYFPKGVRSSFGQKEARPLLIKE